MSLFRPLAAIAACFALAGCGFQPLYGQGERADALAKELASIRVAQITEHYGQVMTNELNDGLNPHALHVPIVYQLDVGLRETTGPYASRADGTPSRTSLSLTATWTLKKVGEVYPVAHGSVKSSAGYDVLDNDYSNTVSTLHGEQRAVADLSDQIQTMIVTYLQTRPEILSPPKT
jgi:LPS-assembly lipoprotein